MRRPAVLLALLGFAAIVVTLLGQEAVLGLRLAFVIAGSVPIGAAVLLAIARLTGAEWGAVAPLTAALPAAAVIGVVALTCTHVPLPPDLATWEHPVFVAARALLALGGVLVFTRRGLSAVEPGRKAGVTSAGVFLALYAAAITPLAADWLLGTSPGHPVSAIGMILAVQQIAAACAAMLILGWASGRTPRDLAALLVAAMLGLGYLAFVDYLVIWYGNLPARVPFYLARGGAVPAAAAAIGIAVPIGAASLGRFRVAGAGALGGIALFDAWWLAATPLALVVALAGVGAIAWIGSMPRG